MQTITKESKRPKKKFKCDNCGCEFDSDEYYKYKIDCYMDSCPIEWCGKICDEVIAKKDIPKKINRRKKN